MSYTVKLATFPRWKAPVPYETLREVFVTRAEASAAGEKALAPLTERELENLASHLQPTSELAGDRCVTSLNVPDRSVHGYLIYDEDGVEVGNWTTLDVAVERAAKS